MRWGAFLCNTSQDDACGSISDAHQSDLFFPVHSFLCLILCKRCNQANGKQDGFVKGLDEQWPYVFRVPPPSSGSAQICVHTCNCLNPLIHHLALEGPDHICGDITKSVAVRQGGESYYYIPLGFQHEIDGFA